MIPRASSEFDYDCSGHMRDINVCCCNTPELLCSCFSVYRSCCYLEIKSLCLKITETHKSGNVSSDAIINSRNISEQVFFFIRGCEVNKTALHFVTNLPNCHHC